jgi:hypothetical protein
MHFMSLVMFPDFIQVLNSINKHPIKIEHVCKHTLFATNYLLQEQKLNCRNYSEQKLNMSNFVQTTEYDVHMYAKFGDFTLLCIFVIKYYSIWFIGIFYNAIMHKMEFGQDYCRDLFTRILHKFISYFC